MMKSNYFFKYKTFYIKLFSALKVQCIQLSFGKLVIIFFLHKIYIQTDEIITVHGQLFLEIEKNTTN